MNDLRFALRTLLRNQSFPAAAVLVPKRQLGRRRGLRSRIANGRWFAYHR